MRASAKVLLVVAFVCSVIAGATLDAAEHVDLPGVEEVHAGPDAVGQRVDFDDRSDVAAAISQLPDNVADLAPPQWRGVIDVVERPPEERAQSTRAVRGPPAES